MDTPVFILIAVALYFGWLWNSRGAVEERQLLEAIRVRENAKRQKLP